MNEHSLIYMTNLYEEAMNLNTKLQEEVERLNNKVEELMTLYTTEREVKEDYKNIIKEVREIFKDYGEKEDIVGYSMYNITGEMLIKLLEILDEDSDKE